jgi:hypothetical protein
MTMKSKVAMTSVIITITPRMKMMKTEAMIKKMNRNNLAKEAE